MTLDFTNVLKGVVTQTLLMALLERGGYRVTRLGIEELFGEVKHIDIQQYLALNLPLPLRYLPDLLVAEIDMTHVFLVEVKFRRAFDKNAVESLHEELKKQREHWPQAYAAIMIAEPVVAGGEDDATSASGAGRPSGPCPQRHKRQQARQNKPRVSHSHPLSTNRCLRWPHNMPHRGFVKLLQYPIGSCGAGLLSGENATCRYSRCAPPSSGCRRR